MKLRIMSDLHNEFKTIELMPVECDAVILAGDTDKNINGAKWAIETFTDIPVLYITGNHEYYSRRIPKVDRLLEELAAQSQLIFLNNSEVILNGVRFLGCTLWSDFCLFGKDRMPFISYEALNIMTDYKCIRLGAEHQYRKLKPGHTIDMHNQSVFFLKKHLEQPFQGPTVVITHHLPSPKSLIDGDLNDLIYAAYCTDLEDLIRQYQPDLWVHGHRHVISDYKIGKTRIICNPRGYADKHLVAGFDPDLVVEV